VDEVRIGVIGAGRMGTRQAEAVRACPGLRLVALVDERPEVASLATRLGCHHEADWKVTIEKAGLDAVCVCVPNHLHEPVANAAMERGLDVLVEKPLADSLSGACRMAAVARRTGRVLQTGFNWRAKPPVEAGLSFLRAGEIGAVHSVHAFAGHNQFLANPDTWFCRRAEAGGGVLLDLGSHLVDLGRQACGEFRSVTHGRVSFGGLPVEVESEASARFLTADGAHFDLFVSWLTSPGMRMGIYGARGAIEIDLDSRSTTLIRPLRPSILKVFPRMDPDPSLLAGMQAFRAAILERRAGGGIQDGCLAQELIALAYQSAGNDGQAVAIPAKDGLPSAP
jgi:predicted dehydrogenase